MIMKAQASLLVLTATIICTILFYSQQPSMERVSLARWPLQEKNGSFLLGTGIESYSDMEETGNGFIMALHYSDQMTGGSANLMNLQCFVGNQLRGVRVVEPFLHPSGSTLGVGLSPSFEKLKPEDMNIVRHSDIFDMDEWTEYAQSQKYAPLISWEDFMTITPKKLILVHHTWYTKDCSEYDMLAATKDFVNENNFRIIRRICLNFRTTGVLSTQHLLSRIYGHYNPNEVTVIFNRWGGIVHRVEDFRYSVRGTTCNRGNEIRLFHHSKQLSNDVKEYSRRYMNKTSQYVAVMVRIEYFAINHRLHKLPVETQRIKLTECFNAIYLKVKSLKEEKKLHGTLLTMDIGKHGSSGLRGDRSPYLNLKSLRKAVDEFFDIMYLDKDDWEDSFESVARFKVSGYIAIMQQELAANSVCLVVAGGGRFQKNAKTLYDEVHPQTTSDNYCVLQLCST